MKSLKLFAIAISALFIISCGGQNSNSNCGKCAKETASCTATATKGECGSCDKTAKRDTCSCAQKSTCNNKAMKKFQKKYTNADFYTNGKFNQEVATKAMREMLAFYDVPFTPFMEANFWVTDFGVGDFENTGMGGIFWVNDANNGYFAHGIYLLPGQMIPEHKHVKTKFPAKFESWMMEKGWCYNFSEVGDATANAPALPASQQATTKSKNFIRQNPGEIVHLKEVETFHFLYAGDEGAVVSEYANYHDGDGLRFSNTKCAL